MPGLLNSVPDYTNRYNTQLSPGDEYQYQQWINQLSAAQGRDVSHDNFDYDMRGAFAGGASQAENAHWPDTYKKPNHPTFSDQSQYHGADGYQGGSWTQMGNGCVFSPGSTNMYGADALQSYLQRSDPTVRLLPKSPAGLLSQ